MFPISVTKDNFSVDKALWSVEVSDDESNENCYIHVRVYTYIYKNKMHAYMNWTYTKLLKYKPWIVLLSPAYALSGSQRQISQWQCHPVLTTAPRWKCYLLPCPTPLYESRNYKIVTSYKYLVKILHIFPYPFISYLVYLRMCIQYRLH